MKKLKLTTMALCCTFACTYHSIEPLFPTAQHGNNRTARIECKSGGFANARRSTCARRSELMPTDTKTNSSKLVAISRLCKLELEATAVAPVTRTRLPFRSGKVGITPMSAISRCWAGSLVFLSADRKTVYAIATRCLRCDLNWAGFRKPNVRLIW